jgi:adenylosuccinate synthase
MDLSTFVTSRRNTMPLKILVGTQWGDEGKGRIVDLLAAGADIVARYNGGDNAGHTVTVAARTFKLHLIPSGIIQPGTTAVIGNGMVINPASLFKEIDMLAAAGIPVGPNRLRLSYAAHLITPAHLALDVAQERVRGQDQIGTTGRGIGPAYTDKASREGLRLQDMLDLQAFERKMRVHIQSSNHVLQVLYNAEPLVEDAVVSEYVDYARKLTPYIGDTAAMLKTALANGQQVLTEGAQGTLLDIDFGTYPFVTSSSPTAPGALVGLGLGICAVEQVIGVTKSFQTRVGSGPFPTEVQGAAAVRLRGTGSNPWDEFGTTTGRPRRVGWLDMVLLRYAVQINGLTDLVVTKMDVLSGLEKLRLCVAYQAGGQRYRDLPLGPADLSPFEPVYEDFPGWDSSLGEVRAWEDLPQVARAYLLRIEELAGVPIRLVSVGPERAQVVEIADGARSAR